MRCSLLRPSLVAAACLFAASAVSVATATHERVLVIGADASLVHDVATASADTTPSQLASSFSPAGLAQLAMDALGLPTGSLLRLSSDPSQAAAAQLLVKCPVQADVFAHVDAYAMVFVDSADIDILTAVDRSAASGYHKIFDLTADTAAGASTKIPSVIARELTNVVGARVQCAGSDVVCARDVLPAVDVSSSALNQVYAQYTFLDRAQAADAALATELAQTQQLTAEVSSSSKATPTTLLAIQFSSVTVLDQTKHRAARKAIATEVQALLTALEGKYPHSSGAQIVAAAPPAGVEAAPTRHAIKTVVAYGRMLLSFDEKIAGSSLESDDDDDDDVPAGNATTSDVTIDDIAEYQIVLWTSVLLGAVLILVILAMCNMNNKRDSLLYAKFTTSNGGRKFD